MTFEQAREKHQKFFYHGFEIGKNGQDLQVRFDFRISPGIKFHPEIIYHNIDWERFDNLDQQVIKNLFFNLGMIELFSYWKACCCPEIIIEAGYLDEEQLEWWYNLLVEGMGEFYYTNQINFLDPNLVRLIVQSDEKFLRYDGDLPDRDLILVGGGKDSAVTLDIIAKSGRDFNSLLLAPTQAARNIVQVGNCPNPIVISRTIDPKLLGLNREGYLNGHTPFSTYLAFQSVIVAILYGYKFIIVSNEASSNEGNVQYLGKSINHQISKSYQFEQSFSKYSWKYLTDCVCYFSFLRPLNELQIAQLFSRMPKYHQVFRSCNKGSKTGVWCLDCPKCLFVALVFYPFLGEKITKIFGKNILDEEKFVEMGKSLIGAQGSLKPFDCVGTHDEVKAAVYLGIKKAGQKVPLVLQKLTQAISQTDQEMETLAGQILTSWNQENNLPPLYEQLLKQELKNEN